ncbi:PREDICTED: uncharacterized protein LOC108609847 [Drosophila arizonae]|uniref:Uncharacterized protein LOC108609847 n=1 Tax=Drosophila arizonae TaxID=7263 RepID=A0ABM1NQ75_DROAR|nr:PREDICTED: uncharacterized protein LOC108609847 [Drosophila arizonae]
MRRMENRKPNRTNGSRFAWDAASTSQFLKLWQENIDDLRGQRVKTDIHREMADKMWKYGLSHIEIKAKIDNMTRKYRIEMLKCRKTGEPSKWKYFSHLKEILKESKLVNLRLCMADNFDFSPWEDSDSMDSFDPHENLLSPPAIEPNESGTSNSPESTASSKSDLSSSGRNSQPSLVNYKLSRSSRSLEIEEARLAVQREKLKVLKDMADDLSAIHRGFLKAYKLKGSIISI